MYQNKKGIIEQNCCQNLLRFKDKNWISQRNNEYSRILVKILPTELYFIYFQIHDRLIEK